MLLLIITYYIKEWQGSKQQSAHGLIMSSSHFVHSKNIHQEKNNYTYGKLVTISPKS